MQEQDVSCFSDYHQAICIEMDKIAKKKNSIFVGQQVAAQDFYGTLAGVPLKKRLEMPVAEEMQVGFCMGLAMEGFLPICIFQRMDFMYRAMDQICNHLDLIKEYSQGIFKPKVIIRTTIGNKSPLDPGLQHTKNLTSVFLMALDMIILNPVTPSEVIDAYNFAMQHKGSVMIIEDQKLYWRK